MWEQLWSQLQKNESPEWDLPQPFPAGQVVMTLLRTKRSVLIASASEGVGRHGPSRGCLRAGKGQEEGQCWAGRKSGKENESSEKTNFRELRQVREKRHQDDYISSWKKRVKWEKGRLYSRVRRYLSGLHSVNR